MVNIRVTNNVVLLQDIFRTKPLIKLSTDEIELDSCFITDLAPGNFWKRIKATYKVVLTYWRNHYRLKL